MSTLRHNSPFNYKSLIKAKIRSVQASRGHYNEYEGVNCKDCGERGHGSKGFYKCKYYKAISADDVGSSKRRKRQSSKVKSEKKSEKRKRQRTHLDASTLVCKNCKQIGHATANSPSCPNHIESKDEVFQRLLGIDYGLFTRKLPLHRAVNQEYLVVLQDKIIKCCKDVRAIVFRSKLFVNAYLLQNQDANIHDCIFRQGFWYSVSQLVLGKQVTNRNSLPADLCLFWNDFKAKYPTIVYTSQLVNGYSQCVTEAAKELQTCYENSIVEMFEERVKKYLKYSTQNIVPIMASQNVETLCDSYLYQKVCKGEPQWPNDIAVNESQLIRLNEVCNKLSTLIDTTVTLKSLSAHPGHFVRPLWYILKEYEREHASSKPYDVRRLPLPRLFFPFPTPSTKWRSITISINALCAFLKFSLPKGYYGALEVFKCVIDFSRLKFDRTNGNDTMFSNIIRSDGYSCDFVFAKRKIASLIASHDLQLDDFSFDEVETSFRPAFIDPGRKSVFTAAVGMNLDEHQIRQCSSKEYYHMTGSTRYLKRLQEEKRQNNIETIESNLPSTKTASATIYDQYAQDMLESLDILFEFYGENRGEQSFRLFQGTKRAQDTMVNMLIQGGVKYNPETRLKKRLANEKKGKPKNVSRGRKKRKKKKDKVKPDDKEFLPKKKGKEVDRGPFREKQGWRPQKFEKGDVKKIPLIVFGNGMFGKDNVKLKGQRCGAVGVLWRAIKRREAAGDLLAVEIDEYKTSRICSCCCNDSLEKLDDVRGHSILVCKTCKILWNRDINASKNMLKISISIWKKTGRPIEFTRLKANDSSTFTTSSTSLKRTSA